MSHDPEYILGTENAEIARLRFQHQAWVAQAYALWTRAGFRAGQTLIDLGSGPGFTSFDLAHLVGAEGRVLAVDESARFLAFLEQERDRRALPQVDTWRGDVEDLELPDASVDGAYSRWLFSWLPDPRRALEQIARCLRPGAAFVAQEYLDWAAMKLVPPGEAHARAVAACMASWTEEIDVGAVLPAMAAEVGLVVEHARPVSRLGGVGSLEWRWLGGFFENYLPKLVERGLMDHEELAAWRLEWAGREREGAGHVLSPTMIDLVLRRPR